MPQGPGFVPTVSVSHGRARSPPGSSLPQQPEAGSPHTDKPSQPPQTSPTAPSVPSGRVEVPPPHLSFPPHPSPYPALEPSVETCEGFWFHRFLTSSSGLFKPSAASASWCDWVCGLGMCHRLSLPQFTQSPRSPPPHATDEPPLLVPHLETSLGHFLCTFATSPLSWEAGAALQSCHLPQHCRVPPLVPAQPRPLCTHPALNIQQ